MLEFKLFTNKDTCISFVHLTAQDLYFRSQGTAFSFFFLFFFLSIILFMLRFDMFAVRMETTVLFKK